VDLSEKHALAANAWEAELSLAFTCRKGATSVAAAHRGPLRVQKALHPEGPAVCHSIVLHPPGGIVGGDHLTIHAAAASGAHALITTPGATKLYRSDGRRASQAVRIHVANGACIEWLPQETIIYDGALAELSHTVVLAPGATYLGWEILCWGRPAAGERFASGSMRQAVRIDLGAKPLWREMARVNGGDKLFSAAAGLAGASVSATLLAAGHATANDLLAQCRAVLPAADSRCGVTRMSDLLVARFVGHSGEAAREYFSALWKLLRPAILRRHAVPPRIWRT
jgi:urease accessory protein